MSINNLVNEFGQIVRRGIHDSAIYRFDYTLNEKLDICLRDTIGTDRWLCTKGVRRLGFKDLVEGTIVSDVFCWVMGDGHRLDSTHVEAWITLLGNNVTDENFNNWCVAIERQYAKCHFVFVESSYGGTIAVICDEVSFVEGPFSNTPRH